jgi:hypothetical protein
LKVFLHRYHDSNENWIALEAVFQSIKHRWCFCCLALYTFIYFFFSQPPPHLYDQKLIFLSVSPPVMELDWTTISIITSEGKRGFLLPTILCAAPEPIFHFSSHSFTLFSVRDTINNKNNFILLCFSCVRKWWNKNETWSFNTLAERILMMMNHWYAEN